MFLRGKIFQMLVLIAIVLIIAYINAPGMFNMFNLRQIMSNITITAIFACGISPLLMCGGIDFSGSSVGNCAAVLLALCFQTFTSIPWPLLIIPALILGGAIGALNAFFVLKLNLMAFIATMAMGTVWGGLAIYAVRSVSVPIAIRAFNNLSGIFLFGYIPLFFMVAIVLIVFYSFLLMKTTFGRNVLMCGGNQVAARLAGLNPVKIRTILFINSGVISAVGGVAYASQLRLGHPQGLTTLMPHMSAFIGSLLGGVSFFGGSGSIAGAFFGITLINVLSYSLTSMGVDLWVNSLLNGSLLIIALTIDDITRRIRLRRLGIKSGTNSMVMPGMPSR